MKISFLFCAALLLCANSLDIKEVVLIISSQSNSYHIKIAEDLKNDIHEQARDLNQTPPVVHLTHKDFPHVGGWAILPLIPYLRKLHHGNCSWFFFMEDKTRIRLKNMVEALGKYDHTEEIWIGHAIRDKEATIIHHFAFFENPAKFRYPNAASGIAISVALMNRLENQWKTRKPSKSDFSIDYAHELALFIWNENKGSVLKHDPAFCIDEKNRCASFSTPFKFCGVQIPNTSVYFAVKTCAKFHETRVAIVQGTWGKYATFINFFSDVQDKSIPTLSLGIPNTEQGHCGKTLAILQYVAKHIGEFPDVRWIVIADDDTILSVSRLRELLSCYNESKPMALGERYGFNIYNDDGYNYLTGGGGIVISRVLLEKLVKSKMCKCPSISSPDDMFLGVCLTRLGVEVVHSSLFHQARPVDYAPEYLQNQPIVSFHKHWMVDPAAIYSEWFSQADGQSITSEHKEL